MQFCSSLVSLKNDWILRSWSWHLQGCTLWHRLAKWFVWHIHHSLHLYLRANLNALVMNLTRCPESELFHNLCSFWCLKEIICLEQVYAFCILKNSWSHLNSIGFCFIHLPPSPIQTAMSVGWNPTFPDVKVGFSAQRVESDQIFADCKASICRDRFTLNNFSMQILNIFTLFYLSFFPFASKFLCSSLSVGSVDTGQDYGAMDPAWLRSLGL